MDRIARWITILLIAGCLAGAASMATWPRGDQVREAGIEALMNAVTEAEAIYQVPIRARITYDILDVPRVQSVKADIMTSIESNIPELADDEEVVLLVERLGELLMMTLEQLAAEAM